MNDREELAALRRLAELEAKAGNIPPEPEFGEKVNTGIGGIPRQLGLTARHGIEGLADFAGIAANPLAATINAASTGPSSRMIESATSEPSRPSEPNLRKV